MDGTMKWVGLTGGIASGKSTVAKVFASRGIPVVSADQLAHDVMKPGSPAEASIKKHFRIRGPLTRERLGAIVFGDPTGVKLRDLEAILHPEVRKLAEAKRRDLEAQGFAVAVYEVPLLFEKDMKPLFDSVVTVAVDESIQVDRLMRRNRLTRHEAYQRIRKQLPLSAKLDGSDFVIWNNSSVDDLIRKADKVAQDLITSSKKHPRSVPRPVSQQ